MVGGFYRDGRRFRGASVGRSAAIHCVQDPGAPDDGLDLFSLPRAALGEVDAAILCDDHDVFDPDPDGGLEFIKPRLDRERHTGL